MSMPPDPPRNPRMPTARLQTGDSDRGLQGKAYIGAVIRLNVCPSFFAACAIPPLDAHVIPVFFTGAINYKLGRDLDLRAGHIFIETRFL